MSNKPLLISDCDEVLLHMVVPFQQWLDSDKHIHFDLENGNNFANALRHKHDGTQVLPQQIWPMLKEFFDNEMHRQGAIEGAVESINRLGEIADVVILTNLLDDRREARAEQLKAVGIDFPVYTNQGGKGELLAGILAEYEPSVTVLSMIWVTSTAASPNMHPTYGACKWSVNQSWPDMSPPTRPPTPGLTFGPRLRPGYRTSLTMPYRLRRWTCHRKSLTLPTMRESFAL
ncbi:HAD family hydrolase [Sphingopyxis sp. BSNA05]|uniref:HAD family hydrolase n=1 Tax=Sphingopyxis sp. BSNA05 TaxID=1236614 RepID=UPI00349FA9D5